MARWEGGDFIESMSFFGCSGHMWFEGCRKVVRSGCCPAEAAGTKRKIQETKGLSSFVSLVNIRSEAVCASVLTAWLSDNCRGRGGWW